MKIGIISDSHDHLENIRKSTDVFRQRNVEFVLHLGDFISPNAIKAFKGIKLVAIFGNNDGDKFRLIKECKASGGEIKGDYYEFQQDSMKISCYHGTELEIRNALVNCGKYDVVISGHTHEYEDRTAGRTRVLNPGTAHGFGDKATIMVFDTVSGEAELIVI